MEDEWDMRTLTVFLEHTCGNMDIEADNVFDQNEIYHTKVLWKNSLFETKFEACYFSIN